jgi:hypothetical protein
MLRPESVPSELEINTNSFIEVTSDSYYSGGSLVEVKSSGRREI